MTYSSGRCTLSLFEPCSQQHHMTSGTTACRGSGCVAAVQVRKLLEAAHGRARKVLKQHEGELHQLARELLDKETLSGKQIMDLMGIPPTRDIMGGATAVG